MRQLAALAIPSLDSGAQLSSFRDLKDLNNRIHSKTRPVKLENCLNLFYIINYNNINNISYFI
jgi:hypothetical protein